MGAGALAYNISGSSNTALGSEALAYNLVGFYNTAVGDGAMEYSQSFYNVAVGDASMEYNVLGIFNSQLAPTLFQHQSMAAAIALLVLEHWIPMAQVDNTLDHLFQTLTLFYDCTAAGYDALTNNIASYNTAWKSCIGEQ